MAKQTVHKGLAEFWSDREKVFTLLRKGSIREQSRTADRFIKMAIEVGLFSHPAERVLIVGAGVTGVATALRAAVHNVAVTVREADPELFSLQAGCKTRFIHPHEYDWPEMPYWPDQAVDVVASCPSLKEDQTFFPRELRWNANAASNIAHQWRAQIDQETPSLATIIKDAPTEHPIFPNTRAVVDPHNDFRFIICCTGAVEQNTCEGAGKFASYTYWSDDPFEHPRLPTLLKCKPLRILISGGGDGGQQDFLRLVCKAEKGRLFSAGALFNKLTPILLTHDEFRSSVERLRSMNTPRRPDPELLWNEHSKLVKVLAGDSNFWPKFASTLEPLVDPLVLSGQKQLTYVFRKNHFGQGFALNSVLVHLVATFLAERLKDQKKPILRPSTNIKGIKSTDPKHVCAGSAVECCGKAHEVKFDNGDPETYDVIIVRHGSDDVVPLKAPKKTKAPTKAR